MDNSLVIDEIEYWNEILATSDNPKLLEMAFFKIYIHLKFTYGVNMEIIKLGEERMCK